MQLSVHVKERNEAARVRDRAQHLGEEQIVLEADANAKQILMRLTRVMLTVNHVETRLQGHHREEDEFDD